MMTAGLKLRTAPQSVLTRVSRPARMRCISVSALAIPDSYGYVMGSIAATALMTQYLAVKVALARKEYAVPYPAMYADGKSEAANIFNCIQRSHQNTLEYLPNVLALQLAMGLQFPLPAAGLGLAWTIGRVIYANGYSSGDPSKRTPGSTIAGIVYLGLIFGTLYAGYTTLF